MLPEFFPLPIAPVPSMIYLAAVGLETLFNGLQVRETEMERGTGRMGIEKGGGGGA